MLLKPQQQQQNDPLHPFASHRLGNIRRASDVTRMERGHRARGSVCFRFSICLMTFLVRSPHFWRGTQLSPVSISDNSENNSRGGGCT